jgi:6-phosphogluconolactonase
MKIAWPRPRCCRKSLKKKRSRLFAAERNRGVRPMGKTQAQRIAVLIGAAATCGLLGGTGFAVPASKPKGAELLFVGTYTSKTESKGIYALRFDEHNGKLSALTVAAESVDPSFVAVDPSGKYLYAVNEVGNYAGSKSGAVSAYTIDRTNGNLTLLNQVASGGADPCFVSLDKTGKFLMVANYTGGSVAIFPIGADGKLGAASAVEQHQGHSVVQGHQEGPHAHWIATSPDNRFVLEADLGIDEVLVDKFDASSGTLTPNDPPFARVESGAGPRHLVFSPNRQVVYVVNELGSTVTVFSYDAAAGALEAKQTIGTLPGDYHAPSSAAEIAIHPSGKFLYVSNRGRDSIAVFGIAPKTGVLTSIGDFLTRGKTPRDFVIDHSGHYLLVANQETNDIEVFRIDSSSGELEFTGERVEVPAPVDIAFAGAT